MIDLINDLNYNIVTEELLEDEGNIEMLEIAIANWQELIAQTRREHKKERELSARWEMDDAIRAEFGLRV